MEHTKQKAFTLVELIVVVTILAILATIGFVSYSSYLIGVRDTNRIAQMTSLSDGLNLYSTTNDLPIPEDNVEVSVNDTLIAYQGYAGANILETINFDKGGLDPKDNTYFSYYLTRDRKFFQMMGFLEESADLTTSISFANKTNAVNFQDRIPTVTGKKLGILTDADNTPIQDLGSSVDLAATASAEYIARLTNDDSITGTSLTSINPIANCKRIRETSTARKDGVYKINPTGATGADFEVYCDMTTDGGGWTYATMLSDTSTKNLFDTGNTDKITSLTNDISSKGKISDVWVDSNNKDIMLICKTTSLEHKGYEKPTIIYNFSKTDIINLEKQDKAGTTLSSQQLLGSWNGKDFSFNTNYSTSGNLLSHYLINDQGSHVFTIGSGVSMYVRSSYAENTAAYNETATDTLTQSLDNSNYCMSAIR